jgi:hypothetical protein
MGIHHQIFIVQKQYNALPWSWDLEESYKRGVDIDLSLINHMGYFIFCIYNN